MVTYPALLDSQPSANSKKTSEWQEKKKRKNPTKPEVQDMETQSTKEDSLLEYRNTGAK